ncbi:MAG: hypothetical protein V3U11_07365 [Planctomycetota bacterium]
MGRVAGSVLGAALLTITACDQLAPVVRYTDELTNPDTGRTALVRAPAEVFGFIGFVGGIPFDILALPATYTYYKLNQSLPPGQATDAVTIFLFPSFVLWRSAVLFAAPLDALEFLAYRAYLPPATLNYEEQEDLENRLDRETLPRHPVEPLYPKPPSPKSKGGAADVESGRLLGDRRPGSIGAQALGQRS